MAQQDLSPQAQKALAAVQKLPQAEQAKVVEIISLDLATEIADEVQTSTPEKIAQASSAISDGIQAALAHGFALASARAGFKQIAAPDGKAAIQVKITRPNGEEVTCLLSEGARGKRYQDLAGYGKENLNGASLLPRADFEAVVESLYSAIRGQKVFNGVLQTEDTALKQVYQIVTQGVRRDGGFSWAVFNLDERGAVAGRRVRDGGRWDAYGFRSACALFGAAPAE